MKKYINSLARKAGIIRKQWENVTFLDKTYKVIKGSVRSNADKDDAWLFALSGVCSSIFDIGCNIGQASLMMLYNENIKRIVLVDPNPSALSFAAENLIHNRLSYKAAFVNAFISDALDQTVDFYTQETGAAGSRYKGFATTAAKLNSHYNVKTLTVDFLSRQFDIVPDLVKIDVEGAEQEVLNGSMELASHKKTMFFVEVHSGPELNIVDNTNGILQWCNLSDYTGWYLKEKSVLNIESIRNRGRYHALLLPKQTPLPEILMSINENDPVRKK